MTLLDSLVRILQELDIDAFKEVTDAPDSVTDEDILEAMHLTRSGHPNISRKQRMDSRRWLYRRLH